MTGAADGVIAQTPRLRIRKLTVDDAPFVLELVSEPSFIANIGDKGLRNLEDAERFLREGPWTNQPKPGYGQFVVELEETGAAVGICGLLFRETLGLTDVGFAVLARYRGKGIAFEAAEALLCYGRSALGLETIVGLTSEGNSASIRLLERLGLTFERRIQMAEDDPGTLVYS